MQSWKPTQRARAKKALFSLPSRKEENDKVVNGLEGRRGSGICPVSKGGAIAREQPGESLFSAKHLQTTNYQLNPRILSRVQSVKYWYKKASRKRMIISTSRGRSLPDGAAEFARVGSGERSEPDSDAWPLPASSRAICRFLQIGFAAV